MGFEAQYAGDRFAIGRGDGGGFEVRQSDGAGGSSLYASHPGTPDGWQVAWQVFAAQQPVHQPVAPALPSPHAGGYSPHAGGYSPMAVYPGPPQPPVGWVPYPYAYPSPYPPGPPQNGLGLAGGIVGIVGLTLSFIPFLGIVIGIPMGIVAVVLSAVALGRQPRGWAQAGLVLGIVTVVLKLIPGINLI